MPGPAAGRHEPGGPPVHPLLLAAAPVLFLFAENAVQQVTLEPLWAPLAAALAGAAVALLACALLLRSWVRGGLLAGILVALFFSFGHAWNVARESYGLTDRQPLAIAWAALAVIALLATWRGGRWVAPTNSALTAAAVVLFAFNAVRVADFAAGSVLDVPATQAASSPIATEGWQVDERPDIYYLILDRYNSETTLAQLYDFDNRPFLDALEARGFAIADESYANYFKTALSLTSSLNMDFLDGPSLTAQGGGQASFAPLHRGLQQRLVVPATLKSMGYEYIHVANSWEPTSTNVDADRVLRYTEGSELGAAVVSTTAWSLTSEWVAPTEEDLGEFLWPPDLLREHTLYQLDALERTAGRPGPTFVFAHLILPHNPWRFNADGSFATAEQVEARTRDENYLEHLRFANDAMVRLVDRLLDVPPGEEPVIIIQADEGEFPIRFARDQVNFDWLEAAPNEIQRKFGILNAFHLPCADPAAAGVHDRLTPVNAFRIVFNACFEAGLPLLPDTTWLSPDVPRMFEFVALPPERDPRELRAP